MLRATTARPAGLLRRLAALCYDALVCLAVLFAATAAALALAGGELPYTAWWFRVYLVLVIFAFFAGFWTHGGQTVGMRAWKIRLEGTDGSPVRWHQALVRFAAGIVTLGAGHLWLLVDGQGRSLYDRISGTRVVRTQG